MNHFKTSRKNDAATKHLTTIESYKNTISGLLPTLPRQLIDSWSIREVDALLMGYFLDYVPRKVTVLEIGTFVGVSTHFFASHEKVSRVQSIDPNPLLADQITANSDRWIDEIEFETLGEARVVDIARSAIGDLSKRVEFLEGVAGSTKLGVKGGTVEESNQIKIPSLSRDDEMLVVFVDGLHTREGVFKDLQAVFRNNSDAIVFLDDCRYTWGHFVQAGVVDFMEQSNGEFTFGLISDQSPSMARSSLGVIYATAMTREVKPILQRIRKTFSEKFDVLKLLAREQDLISEVNSLLAQVNDLTDELSHRGNSSVGSVNRDQFDALQRENETLKATLNRRSHKLAESSAKLASRIPGIRSVAIRKSS